MRTQVYRIIAVVKRNNRHTEHYFERTYWVEKRFLFFWWKRKTGEYMLHNQALDYLYSEVLRDGYAEERGGKFYITPKKNNYV